ncbi:phosphoglycerate transport system sensor protein PgtB [Klebsiella michiganensis]|uniref:Phosphoglycerate transport system sensor protein PgtB n=1 Tax=Klebsiella michiganensis TaxID=1134687 RepID=A0A7H4MZE0_9ENTR|nr:phosphoglycerate transport system sensor protein PgtB [Klebsiella michiganensis]
MMARSILQRLRQISISSSLRGAFLMGALLTLIVSSVSLYSWHEQSSQIRYSLDEYFPRIHSAFLIEGNLNLVVDQLNEFLLARIPRCACSCVTRLFSIWIKSSG